MLGRCRLEVGSGRVSCFDGSLLRLWSAIVVCDLDSNLTRIFALAGQVLPDVVLSSTRNNDVLQVNPCFADEIRLLVISEDRDLELVVVGRVVNRKA